jgi:hypothetical protein
MMLSQISSLHYFSLIHPSLSTGVQGTTGPDRIEFSAHASFDSNIEWNTDRSLESAFLPSLDSGVTQISTNLESPVSTPMIGNKDTFDRTTHSKSVGATFPVPIKPNEPW